jgi:hypothetical protein
MIRFEMVVVTLWILNACVVPFCCVWSLRVHVSFYGLNLCTVLVFVYFFSLLVVFNLSIALSLLLPAYFICFQAVECFYGTQWLRIQGSNGSTRLDESLPEDGSRAGCQNVVLFYILDDGEAPPPKKKWRLCQRDIHHLQRTTVLNTTRITYLSKF